MNTHSFRPVALPAERGFFANRLMSAAAAAVLTVVWLAAAQPTHADEIVVATTTVKYGDLNLKSESGARNLYRRLQRAAAEVCDGVDARSPAYRTCYERALAGAVDKVGAPALYAVHRASAGSRIG